MDKNISIVSVAAPMPRADIDTDLIYPARFLLLIEREKVGSHLFHDLRRDGCDGLAADDARFILDIPPYDKAEILVVGPGFGTGSSREHAVWALVDNGIRAIVATSLGEIFQSNCVENGMAPIILEDGPWARVLQVAESGTVISIDLDEQQIHLGDSETLNFDLDCAARRRLLSGVDTIDEILADSLNDIASFEEQQRGESPWLYLEKPNPLITPPLNH